MKKESWLTPPTVGQVPYPRLEVIGAAAGLPDASTAENENPPAWPAGRVCTGGFLENLLYLLDGTDSGGLGALRAVADFEFDLLVFLEGAEARTLDLRVVDKHISGTIFRGDETEPLLRVEPLHSSLWHLSIFPFLLGAEHRISVRQAWYDRHTSLSRRNFTRPINLAGTAAATSILRKFDTNTEAATRDHPTMFVASATDL